MFLEIWGLDPPRIQAQLLDRRQRPGQEQSHGLEVHFIIFIQSWIWVLRWKRSVGVGRNAGGTEHLRIPKRNLHWVVLLHVSTSKNHLLWNQLVRSCWLNVCLLKVELFNYSIQSSSDLLFVHSSFIQPLINLLLIYSTNHSLSIQPSTNPPIQPFNAQLTLCSTFHQLTFRFQDHSIDIVPIVKHPRVFIAQRMRRKNHSKSIFNNINPLFRPQKQTNWLTITYLQLQTMNLLSVIVFLGMVAAVTPPT